MLPSGLPICGRVRSGFGLFGSAYLSHGSLPRAASGLLRIDGLSRRLDLQIRNVLVSRFIVVSLFLLIGGLPGSLSAQSMAVSSDGGGFGYGSVLVVMLPGQTKVAIVEAKSLRVQKIVPIGSCESNLARAAVEHRRVHGPKAERKRFPNARAGIWQPRRFRERFSRAPVWCQAKLQPPNRNGTWHILWKYAFGGRKELQLITRAQVRSEFAWDFQGVPRPRDHRRPKLSSLPLWGHFTTLAPNPSKSDRANHRTWVRSREYVCDPNFPFLARPMDCLRVFLKQPGGEVKVVSQGGVLQRLDH